VNAVAPGPVDTAQFKKECEENPNQYYLDAQATYEINQDPSQVMLAAKYVCSTGLKRPVPPNDVAKSILFLASENWSGSITGQVLNVDCGKQGKVTWTKEELHSN
jgi:NAD(P)-dependent dehydrogenase (short-subunit alcohol dehydrogenase family)